MNANVTRIHSRGLQLRVLCLAIGIALTLPLSALAQDTQVAPEQTAKPQSDADTLQKPAADDQVALEQKATTQIVPESLKQPAQLSSSVEVGAHFVSDDSFRFGRYTGLNEQGLTPLLNLDLFYRGAYDSGNARYWSFKGANLGLDSREAAFEYGVQGSYKLLLDYDQIPMFGSDSTRTIFDGAGSNNLTLPANWVGSGTTAGMTQLLPSLKSFDLKTERQRTGVGFSGVLSPQWDFSTSYKHETKDGNKSIGGVFGNSGGNPRAVILPEPVDYTTQQIDAALRFKSKKLQVQVAYYLSVFSDQNDSLFWSNPYTTITGWAAGAGFPAGRGQLSLPPDNKFHQLSVNAGYNISDSTRVSASVARGRMTQNEPFLPYTNIPVQAASITQPLPRASLDGRIDTTVVNLRIASRPWQNFSWNAAYRYDDRDNQTPRNEYVYIGGDTQLQPTGVTSSKRRFNTPFSYNEEQYKAEAVYRVFGYTSVSAGAQRSKINRTYAEREHTDENSYNLGLSTQFSERFNAQLRYTQSQRDGSFYDGNEPVTSGHSAAYVATLPGGFITLPGLRKFNLADRDREQASATLSFSPTEAWTLGAMVDHAKDTYNNPQFGLVDARINSFTLDTVYAPSVLWSTYAFYTYDKMASNQKGRSFSSGALQLATSSDPNRNWFFGDREHVDTYGAGYKRSFESLDLGVDYLYSKSRSDLNFAVGSALLTRPLPPAVTRLDTLSLYGTYKMRENMSLRLSYWYENYHSTDWAVDGIAPNTLANVILLGENSPDYKIHVISGSWIYRF